MKKKDSMPDVREVVAELKKLATRATLDGMARYGIPSDRAFGVPMAKMKALARRLGRSHSLAGALWNTGWYEARIVAAFVDEPERVTPAQMDQWARDFRNWAVCDTVCFHLFDRTPHALRKVEAWAGAKDEFVRRGAFALLACVALHDREADDAAFLRCLPLAERAATDARNFVKKGVVWALRAVGGRSPGLYDATTALTKKLAASADPTARWVGNDASKGLKKRPGKSRQRTKH